MPDSLDVLLDLIALNPVVSGGVAIIFIAWLVARIRSGAALDPFDIFRAGEENGVGHYTLDELRQDYDPDEKWNRPPTDHDRI